MHYGKSILRITLVWVIALFTISALTGQKDFLIVFVTYGILLTFPVIIIFIIALSIERTFLSSGHYGLAIGTGPAMSALIISYYFFNASDKKGMIEALKFIAPLSLGTGFLWMISALIIFPAKTSNVDPDSQKDRCRTLSNNE